MGIQWGQTPLKRQLCVRPIESDPFGSLLVPFWFRWPDIIIGLVIAVIFLRSAMHVLSAAAGELRRKRPAT